MMMNAKNLRYIVFLIDSKYKQHDGKIFCTPGAAREFLVDTFTEDYADKAIIAEFYMEPEHEFMFISTVETFGFHHDKKRIEQMELFEGVKI
jgi:hypothetical protein